MTTKFIGYALALGLAVMACKGNQQQAGDAQTGDASQPTLAPAPTFNPDSAYAYIEQQVAFGPRVPNTAAHRQAGDYLVRKLKQFGFTVTEQKFVTTTWDGQKLNARNIIGTLNPQAAKRILLASHWDSRPVADQDPKSANRKKPVPAANDGASGVGVLLELARTIQQAKDKPNVGIDIIFFDAEDWGNSDKALNDKEPESPDIDYVGFCLGSRYWARNPHQPNYSAYYGILLDMVGAKGATFRQEGYSLQYAAAVVRTVWETASRLGYSQYFINEPGAPITDDHLPANTILKFPMIDIIDYGNRGFFEDWHTVEDDMRNIDKNTLKAVGQTITQTLYNEQ